MEILRKLLVAKNHGPECLALPNEICTAAIVFSCIKRIKHRLFMMTKSILNS